MVGSHGCRLKLSDSMDVAAPLVLVVKYPEAMVDVGMAVERGKVGEREG